MVNPFPCEFRWKLLLDFIDPPLSHVVIFPLQDPSLRCERFSSLQSYYRWPERLLGGISASARSQTTARSTASTLTSPTARAIPSRSSTSSVFRPSSP